jgi:hypothetical protein
VKDELRKLLRIFTSQEGTEETCEACGGKFMCGATLAGCWCSEVKISEAARAELKQKYKGCVCRACLEKFTEREAGEAR